MRDDDLPTWLREEEIDDPGHSRRARRITLVALAVLPWLVVLGLLLSGALPPDAGTDPGGPRERDADAEDTDDTPDHGVGDIAAPHGGGLERPGTPGEPRIDDQASTSGHPAHAPAADDLHVPQRPDAGPQTQGGLGQQDHERRRRAGAVALLVARSWLTDVGPGLEVEGIAPRADRYLEHAVVEGIDEHGGHAVVSLLGVVLEREDDAYVRASSVRIAVPMTLEEEIRPLGPPSWLPGPDLRPVGADLREVDDPDVLLTLAEALDRHGIGGTEVSAAARTPQGWWRVEVRPADHAPDDDDQGPSPDHYWLRPGPSGPVVAGLPLSADHDPVASQPHAPVTPQPHGSADPGTAPAETGGGAPDGDAGPDRAPDEDPDPAREQTTGPHAEERP